MGGKDAAYVREDADPKWAAEEIADGAFFNAGQSCCAIERVYVHERVYDDFVGKLVEVVSVRLLFRRRAVMSWIDFARAGA